MKTLAFPSAVCACFAAAGLLVLAAGESPAAVVIDQPDGFTDPFSGAGGHSDPGSGRAVSADGRYVAFVSSSDGLSDADDDRVLNVLPVIPEVAGSKSRPLAGSP